MVMIMTELWVEREWKLTLETSLKIKSEVKLFRIPIVIPTVILIFEAPKKL